MADEEKVTVVAPASEEQVQEERPKSEKKSKEKTPKSPKSSKRSKDKKSDTDAVPEAGHAAEEKTGEKVTEEEEQPKEEKPVAESTEPSSPKDERVETTETGKKDKKNKKDDKKEKKETTNKEEAAAPSEEKPVAPSVASRGRSNSKNVMKTAQQLEEEADTADTIRIWHHPGNVRSSRVLWLLKELEGSVAEHLKVSIQASHKEKREGFAAINPSGEVPTLRFGNPGWSLFEPGTPPHKTHTYTNTHPNLPIRGGCILLFVLASMALSSKFAIVLTIFALMLSLAPYHFLIFRSHVPVPSFGARRRLVPFNLD